MCVCVCVCIRGASMGIKGVQGFRNKSFTILQDGLKKGVGLTDHIRELVCRES